MPVQISGSGTTAGLNNGLYNPTLNTIGIVTNNTEQVRISSGGSVGIGTTNPSYRLDVSGTMRASSSLDAIGNVRDIPVNIQTATYTLTATDAGRCVTLNAGSGITIPQNIFSAGHAITVYNNTGTGVTIFQGTGTSLYFAGLGTTGNRTLPATGFCSIFCFSNNQFAISGTGLV